jgi:hypothetical protein
VAQLTAKLIFEAAIQKTLDMLVQADVETAYLIPRLRPDEYILYFGRLWVFMRPCSELGSRYLPNTLTGFVCLLAFMVSNKLQIIGTMNFC